MVTRPAALRLLLVVCLCALAMPGFAQTTDQQPEPEPAHLAYLDGEATVVRDGRAEQASINIPLVAGDQLRTRDGRVEVVFGDRSILDADNFTTVDFLSDSLLRLLDGRIRLTISGRDRVAYRIDTPWGAVRIDSPGEYRLALITESGRKDIELVTIRGYATLINELGETSVRAGERAYATPGLAPSYAQAYNSANWDAFDRWAADRREERTGAASAQYLPSDIQVYASDFDRYGDWRYEATYGYVWYPRVHVGWRPYYHGRWNYYRPWGWTWIAYDPWGWPTHHYGRWGFSAGIWFWIPAPHWGPAYVYWAGSSGYVGWCPLGWNNRPVYNIHGGYGYRGHHGYDPYHAWTVVPRRAFASHVEVSRHAVNRTELDRAVPRWYVSGPSAPVRPAVTARGAEAPIYTVGRGAPSRASVSGTETGPQRTAPRAWGSGATISGYAAAEPERAVSRSGASISGSPGIPARSQGAPRATAPASPGALGPSTSWPRYRDMGPGGQDARDDYRGDARAPDRQDGSIRSVPRESAAPRGVPDNSPATAPRGVPDNSRVYAPRGVPRDDRIYSSPRQPDQPAPTYRPPMRERPDGYERGGGISGPRPSNERPTYGRPSGSPGPGPSAAPNPGGGGGGRERAAPRGGSSAPPAPRGGSGGGERAHSRRPG